MDYVPTTHKFVAVLNKKVPTGRLMNALGHMTAGLVSVYPNKDEFRMGDYSDADGGKHPSISDNPFIVLEADNSNQIRTLRKAFIERGLPYADFTSTMVEGTYADQQERTKHTKEIELEYFGIVTFGDAEVLRELTKKFSLWRG